MSEYTEQRHFSRIPFDAEVQITDPLNDSKHSARLLDISLKGALTTQPDALVAEVNKPCLLELSLTDSNNDLRLEMEALVVDIVCVSFGHAVEVGCEAHDAAALRGIQDL